MVFKEHIAFILGFAMLLVACQNSKHDPAVAMDSIDIERVEKKLTEKNVRYLDLVSTWKEDAGSQFFLTKKVDDFKFTAIYKPYTILAMEESEEQQKDLNDTISLQFKHSTNAYHKMHFFNFNIQNESFKNELLKFTVDDGQAYYDRITYYSFSVKKDVYMIEDNDTLKCDFVNFERTYEANPGIMLSLAFTRKATKTNYKNLKLVFEDNIFNKGKLIFNFDTQPILLLNYLKPLS